MTTPDTFAKMPPVPGHIVFPDPPEDPDDKMTSFDHLTATGNAYRLIDHLGNRETTLVAGERYLALAPTRSLSGVRYPDLLVAFGVDPEAYYRSKAYVISEQGKPPDLVLEVASESTGAIDVGAKRVDYASLGIPEYWRFDETGEYHKAKLAGDRLVNGVYVPIEIEELPGGVLQGYSAALSLYLRWEDSALVFYDSATGEPIASLDSERRGRFAAEARADSAEAIAEAERQAREDERARADSAEANAEAERQAREAAEARVQKLEERLRGLGA